MTQTDRTARRLTLREHARLWTDREVWYWKWRLLGARITYARSEAIGNVTMGTLRLLDRLGVPIPDRVFRLAARLNGFRWPPIDLYYPNLKEPR